MDFEKRQLLCAIKVNLSIFKANFYLDAISSEKIENSTLLISHLVGERLSANVNFYTHLSISLYGRSKSNAQSSPLFFWYLESPLRRLGCEYRSVKISRLRK